jgi:curved DNA-binding protein
MATRSRFDKDYYATMGLRPDATEEEIRRAYRHLALRWHPDRNPGDPSAGDRFKEISEAYAVLIDPAKRRQYDASRRVGATGFRLEREDIFRDLFADPRASAVFEELAREFARVGLHVDRQYFRQTLFGGRAVVSGGVFVITPFTPVLALLRLVRASMRGATGIRADSRPEPLRSRPAGVLTALGSLGRWLLGVPADVGVRALGEADVVRPLRLTRAEAARGGRRRVALGGDRGRREEVLVTIPAGVRPGTRLRLRGRGRAAGGGRRGDLYLAVEVTDEGA